MVQRFLLAAALGTVACSDYNVSNNPGAFLGPHGVIEVDPGALQFGELRAGEEETQTFIVRNIGDALLEVSDVVIGSGLSFDVLGPETLFDLDPGEETTVEVRFSPMEANENYGQVLVLSDDPNQPEAPVDLLGLGSVPELRITPDNYTFTEALVPCGGSVALTLENVGREDLVITSFSYDSDLGLMALDDGGLATALPLTLTSGQAREGLTVTFAATTAGSDLGTLSVVSNDPRGTVTADQSGEGSYLEENAELFTEPGVPPVDVLMLIDNSCSMEEDNLSDVRLGMGPFVDTLEEVADWQLLQVTEQDGCGNEGVLDENTANVETILIDNAFSAAPTAALFTEQLLEHAATALSKTAPGACNEGFLRAGSLLHIIVISDEPEGSGTPYTSWLDDYETYVAGPDYLKVSAVVDLTGCGLGGTGYIGAANATGGTILDICTPDWGSDLSDIASEVLDGVRTYNLAEPAAPETVVVKVNGVVTTDIVVNGNTSVTINSPAIGEGDLVEIVYSVLAEC
jgi:hypothetical protein